MPTEGKLDTMQDGVLVKSLRQSLQQSRHLPTAEKVDTIQDGVSVKSLGQSLHQSFPTAEILDTMQDGILVNSLRQRLQQSFANSRNTRYNAGWHFSQITKTKLTAIICQEQKY